MTKDDISQKKYLAKVLYMQGLQNKDIAEKVNISTTTISKWATSENWKELRSANTVTRKELVNKILLAINTALDRANATESISSKEIDQLCKLASTIERLDKKNNVVVVIEVFTAFVRWLQARMQIDGELSLELVKAINRYQDLYIADCLTLKE